MLFNFYLRRSCVIIHPRRASHTDHAVQAGDCITLKSCDVLPSNSSFLLVGKGSRCLVNYLFVEPPGSYCYYAPCRSYGCIMCSSVGLSNSILNTAPYREIEYRTVSPICRIPFTDRIPRNLLLYVSFVHKKTNFYREHPSVNFDPSPHEYEKYKNRLFRLDLCSCVKFSGKCSKSLTFINSWIPQGPSRRYFLDNDPKNLGMIEKST